MPNIFSLLHKLNDRVVSQTTLHFKETIMDTYKLTNKEYNALLTLYHEYNDAFIQLPNYIKQAFYQHLYTHQ